MKTADDPSPLVITPRPSETLAVRMPTDVLQSLRREAIARDMPVEALVRFYVGAGLRQDLAKRLSERLLDSTARVLSQHISSEAEVSTILQEIRAQAFPTAASPQDVGAG